MEPLTISMMGLGGLAAALASALGVADRYLRVEVDPRVEKIVEALPSVNCGACGYAGCSAYAEAMVKSDASASKCAPGGRDVAEEIAEIMGTEAGAMAKQIAVIHCRTTIDERKVRARYVGPTSCALDHNLGGHTECSYGCLGQGECVASCPFDSIQLIKGLPVVDPEKCTACGNCVDACPRDIITLEPFDAEHGVVYVACNSEDKGPAAKRVCDQSCLGCGICRKQSEHGLFDIKNFLAVPLQEAISQYQEEADELITKCPRESIVREYNLVQIESSNAE
jgi:Na+-translocating ferredoxin:NAD+ oxidoreductase subunit B